ncbi:MAG: Lrp/AsnC family transcriptional regulator, partial [Thermoplasmatota archaeon]
MMDETDLRLLSILNHNSRIPIRELADAIGISVQATHRRVQTLVDTRVIERFTADLSLKFLKAIPIGVYGKCKVKDITVAIKGLGKHWLGYSFLSRQDVKLALSVSSVERR